MLYKFLNQKLLLVILLFFSVSFHYSANGQTTDPQANKNYFSVENYYKVKWGYAEEFIDLWKKNHYPLLKKAQEKGDIISIRAEKPRLHSGEDTRWDFRVILVFKNSQLAFDADLTTPYKQLLYPDTNKLIKDEQHRFELLLSHWDIETEKIEL
jgi:hypothetical protein